MRRRRKVEAQAHEPSISRYGRIWPPSSGRLVCRINISLLTPTIAVYIMNYNWHDIGYSLMFAVIFGKSLGLARRCECGENEPTLSNQKII